MGIWGDLGGFGRLGEIWGELGRFGEIWGDLGDLGRFGGIWVVEEYGGETASTYSECKIKSSCFGLDSIDGIIT